jgi:hypothetical protein
LLGRVAQPGVEPVIAEIGGGGRVPFRPVVEVLLRQRRELTIGVAAHLASSSLPPNRSEWDDGPVRVLLPIPDRDFDVTEVAVPWRILRDAGHEVVFATERAGTVRLPIPGC